MVDCDYISKKLDWIKEAVKDSKRHLGGGDFNNLSIELGAIKIAVEDIEKEIKNH